MQVVLDRTGADEQLCADLGVGEAVLGESGDLCLLGCEHAARLVGALARALARGPEFASGALGKCLGSDAAEHFVRCSQLLTRVHAPVLTAEPFAVEEVRAGELSS